MIQKPELPPILGYVEVEVDGERLYQDVNTGEYISPEDAVNHKYITYKELSTAIQEGVNLL